MTISKEMIQKAKEDGLPLEPNPGNSFETQLVNLQTSQDSFDISWNDIKDQYSRFLNEGDRNGVTLAVSRARLLITLAQKRGWQIQGMEGPWF